ACPGLCRDNRAPLRKKRRHETGIVNFRGTGRLIECFHGLVSMVVVSRGASGGYASAHRVCFGMVQAHDRTSLSLAVSSTVPRAEGLVDASARSAPPASRKTYGRDPLSDVLRTVKLTGALFFLVDASNPWGVNVPHAGAFSSIILPGAQHVVSYHVILKGAGWANLPGVASTWFEAGDVLVFPHGDPYLMLSEPDQPPEFDVEATMDFFRAM